MRCTRLASILATITVLATIIPAFAQARVPVGNQPRTLPPSLCGFAVHIGIVSDNEYQDVTTLADGTTITDITGNLVESFTNVDTGKTIIRNVSGPTTTTSHPDGSGTEVGRGNNWWGFGPHSQANTGEPGLVFTSGRVVLQFAGGAVTGFSLSGKQENGCALLS